MEVGSTERANYHNRKKEGKLTKVLLSASTLFLFFFSCARGCGKKEEEVKESKPIGLMEPGGFIVGGVVVDADTEEPVEGAFVELRIDIDGDGFFSPQDVRVFDKKVKERYSIITSRNGSFQFNLPDSVREIITARARTGNIITSRVITARAPRLGEKESDNVQLPAGEIARLPIRVSLRVRKEGYVNTSVELPPKAEFRKIKLKRALSAEDDNPSDGIQFTMVGGEGGKAPKLFGGVSGRLIAKSQGETLMEIDIPKEALPEEPKEVVRAQANWVNPYQDPSLMPGSFGAIDPERGNILLQTAGFVSIELKDETGKEINPSMAKLKMKIPEDIIPTLYDYVRETTDKVEIPMWYYDEERGLWMRGRNLGVVVDETGNPISPTEFAKITLGKTKKKLYVVSEVEHLSAWNVDYPIDTHSSLMGRIVDGQGNPIKGLHITTLGVTYGGLGDWKGSYTDENGVFGVDVKRSQVEVPAEPTEYDPGTLGVPDIFPISPVSAFSPSDMCWEQYSTFWDIVGSDIRALGETLDEIYERKLISDTTYNALNRIYEDIWEAYINGDWEGVRRGFKQIYKGVDMTDKTAGLIEAERWDRAARDLIKLTQDEIFGLIFVVGAGEFITGSLAPKKLKALRDLMKGVPACGKLAAKLSAGEYFKAIKRAYDIAKGQYDISQDVVDFTTSMMIDPDVHMCFRKVGEISSEAAELLGKIGTLSIIAAKYVGYVGSQILNWWGTEGEYRAAKAKEIVQDNLRNLYKRYNELIFRMKDVKVGDKTLYDECKPFFDEWLSGSQAPKFVKENSGDTEKKRIHVESSDTQVEQSQEFPELLSLFYLNVMALVELYKFLRDYRNIMGGHEEYSFWALPSSEEPGSGGTSEENEYVKLLTSAPETRGGAERSKILINGFALNLTTDLGVDILNVGSPVLPSTRNRFIRGYYYTELAKNPSRWIGTIVLDPKTYKLTVRLRSKKGTPFKNVPIFINSILKRGWYRTDENGEVIIETVGKVELSSAYFNTSTDVYRDTLIEFVLNRPPVITSMKFEPIAQNTLRCEGTATDPDEDKITQKITFLYDDRVIHESEGGRAQINFEDPGIYTCCFKVDDGDMQRIICEHIYFPGKPPKIQKIDYPKEISEGEVAQLSVSVEYVSSYYLSYYWWIERVNGSDPDENSPGVGRSSASIMQFGNTAKFIPEPVTSDTTYRVWVKVVDRFFSSSQTYVDILVKDVKFPPDFSPSVDRDVVQIGENVWFFANCRNCRRVKWDFGDGNAAEGEQVQHTYTEYGKYTVLVEAESIDGVKGTKKLEIKVMRKPYVEFSVSPQRVRRGEKVIFSLDITTFGTPLSSILWDFDGDGVIDKTGMELKEEFTFSIYHKSRRYFPSVIVRYSEDQIIVRNADVLVENLIPQVLSFSAEPTEGVAPVSVSFSVSATDDTPGFEYIFVFGDGVSKVSSTPSISYTYSSAGTYIAKVYVRDSDGAYSSPAELTIVVRAVQGCPPVSVSLSANPTSGYSPLRVTLTASATGGPFSEFRWDIDSDNTIDYITTSSSIQVTYVSSVSTIFYAKVIAINYCGNSGYNTTSIEVMAKALEHSSDFFTPITTPLSVNCLINDDSFTVADINTDGTPDIVYTSIVNGFFGVLIGSGDGTFVEGATYPLYDLSPVIADDFDKDGLPDVVYLNPEVDRIYVYFRKGVGDGTFQAEVSSEFIFPTYVGCFPVALSSGYLNSDSEKDIFVGCSGYSFALTGDGTGRFFPYSVSLNYPGLSQGWLRNLVVKDMNGDGLSDVLALDYDSGKIYVLRNTGGGFNLDFSFDITGIQDIGVGDFDVDGKDEIVAYSEGTTLYIFRNSSSGSAFSFSLASTTYIDISDPSIGAGILVSDLNDDGVPDIAITENVSAGSVTFFTLMFGTPYMYPGPMSSYYSSVSFGSFIGRPHMFSADFTSDGAPDVVLIHWGNCSFPDQPATVLVMRRKIDAFTGSPIYLEKFSSYGRQYYNEMGCSSTSPVQLFIIAFVSFFFLFLFHRIVFFLSRKA